MKSLSWRIAGALLLVTSGALAQNDLVAWCTFDMGSGACRGTNAVVSSAIGQQFVGVAYEGNSVITAGLLCDTLIRQRVVAVAAPPPLPSAYTLYQNFPNPFNPTTVIRYAVPRRAHVELAIYNSLGQRVIQLIDADVDAGSHEVALNGERLASGIYFYRLRTRDFVQVKALTLLK
jgi:hypothetical protein